GSGELVLDSGTAAGVATIEVRKADGTLITATDVSGVEAAASFTLPIDVQANMSTGIAIANAGLNSPVTVNLQLIDGDGNSVATSADIRLNSLGSRVQIADFLTNLFPQLRGAIFSGSVIVQGSLPGSLAAAALTVSGDEF